MSDEIFEQTVQFLKGTLDWLRTICSVDQHRWTDTWLGPGPSGGTQIKGSTRPDLGSLLAYNWMSCPVYSAFTNFLAANEVFGSLRQLANANNYSFTPIEPDTAARGLIRAYLAEVTSLQADAVRIQEVARNFSGSVAARRTRSKQFALLDGFTSTLEEIDCGLGYRIRRLSVNEYARYIDRHPHLDMHDRFWIRQYTIEKVTDIDLTTPVNGPWHSYDPMLGHIISSLRILGPGRVAAPKMDVGPADPGMIVILACTGGNIFGAQQIFTNEYSFTEDKVGDLQKIFNYLASTALPKELEIAVQRINSAVARQMIEDSLIDHIIALEALLGDNTDKFPYKLAMRAAVFLESNLESASLL